MEYSYAYKRMSVDYGSLSIVGVETKTQIIREPLNKSG